MEKIEFAGFAWPRKEWALPKGPIANRVRKVRYTSGYHENTPRRAEYGKGISFCIAALEGNYWLAVQC